MIVMGVHHAATRLRWVHRQPISEFIYLHTEHSKLVREIANSITFLVANKANPVDGGCSLRKRRYNRKRWHQVGHVHARLATFEPLAGGAQAAEGDVHPAAELWQKDGGVADRVFQVRMFGQWPAAEKAVENSQVNIS